jgi:hypothetical protein
MGARAAARTAMEAMDAATSPSPGSITQPLRPPGPSASRTSVPRPQAQGVVEPPPRRSIPRSPISTVQAARVSPAARAAAGKFAAPLRAASRALWLEFTGSFFALFAVSFAAGTWHARAGITAAALPAERHNFYIFLILTLLFGYFSVSSFLRAKKR